MLWSTPGTQLRKHALFEHIDGTESKRVTSVGEHLGREATKRPPLHGALGQRGRKQLYIKSTLCMGQRGREQLNSKHKGPLCRVERQRATIHGSPLCRGKEATIGPLCRSSPSCHSPLLRHLPPPPVASVAMESPHTQKTHCVLCITQFAQNI